MRQITRTGQVTLSGTANLIRSSNVPTAAVLIKNTNATTAVYLGNADVTTSNGHYLGPMEAITIPVQTGVYGVTTGASVLVTFIEVQ
jgi:hypothetical protein